MEENNDEILFEDLQSEQLDKEVETAGYKINTYGADMTLEILAKKIHEKEVSVPPFQRRYVWPIKKASRLIESFLLGLPVPQIFLFRREKTQDLLVVDGQQRLKTIYFFIQTEKFDDNTDFYLQGVKQQWEGKKFSQLSEPDKRRLKNSILRTTIFEQVIPDNDFSMFEIFERLNTGGIPLSQQEIRNCIYYGEIVEFLKELNETEKWRLLLRQTLPDKRLRDIELILRFLALYENWEDYKKPMKDFISNFMKKYQKIGEEKKKELKKLFLESIEKVYDELGNSAFRLKGGVNVAILDSVCVAIARIGPENISNLKEKYSMLLGLPAYLEDISTWTTDKDMVEGRIKIAMETLSK